MNFPSMSNQKPARRITSRAREALITDPEGLLTALASAERAARDAEERARHEGEMRHTPPAPIAEADSPDGDDSGDGIGTNAPSPVVALPRLRDDERFARPEHREVVVIIRRRRAA